VYITNNKGQGLSNTTILLVNYDMFRPTQRPSSGYRFRDYC